MLEYRVVAESISGNGGNSFRKGAIITESNVGARRIGQLLRSSLIEAIVTDADDVADVEFTNDTRIIVAVIVHDRIENLREWIRCFSLSNDALAELVVIHNFVDADQLILFRHLCESNNVKYIPRVNVGYDIGAFQDVCGNRLYGFPSNWSHLLWCTDDFIPMKKTFVMDFFRAMKPNVGVACLEISREVKLHIRTSGFMVSRYVASSLVFATDAIVSKAHCYEFEHRSKDAFLDQVLGMGKKAIQVNNSLAESSLWDTGLRAKLNLWQRHYDEFPNKAVMFICPIFNSYPQIISSLLCQTNPNWRLLLIHDGPNSTGLEKIIQETNDSRIQYIVHAKRTNDWGHSLRRWALDKIKNLSHDVEFVVITNPDNYYIPTFVQEMTMGFTPETVATYCSHFVHGYVCPNKVLGDHRFGVIETELKLGMIDCGGVMARKKYACEVGWSSLEIYSDWTYFSDLIKKYGSARWKKVLGTLFVHN